MKERRAPQPVVARCKLVLVGDVQCGKTAMLQVLAKDCYPEVSGPPAGQLFSLPARLPVARFPPAGGEGDLATPPPQLTARHPAPSSAARLEDRPASASPETCSTSAAPLAPPHLFTHRPRSDTLLPPFIPGSTLGRGNWGHLRVWGFFLT